ncbi:MAG: efflux RND transporter periplasmic adaptor subunit, partial [Pseudomonadales bacterium]|nr:efflux RND transporter periplasmic adaptor subunit [Pseudomonadales bacterium]
KEPSAVLNKEPSAVLNKEPSAAANKGALDRTIPVQRSQVMEVTILEPIVVTGSMYAIQSTDISAMVSGLVEKVYVSVGDRVKQGQPLMMIRQTELKLRIEQLEFEVKLAQAEHTDAKNDLSTNLGLSKRGAISQDAIDNTKMRYDVTQSQLGIAKVRLELARQNLDDSVSKAPYDGVITERNINEGAFVQTMGGGGMGNAPPDLQIQKIDIIVAGVRIPDSELSKISVGSKARVKVDSLDGVYDTQIHAINDLIDPDSRTIDVRIGIDNADYAIKPGLFARVEIFPPERQILTVSRSAVLGIDAHYVYINENGVARKNSVTITEMNTDQAEIVSGLQAGQYVLTGNNVSRLQDGSPIIIQEL